MISYDNLWEIMKEKKITQYKLIYHYGLSTSLINRLKKNLPITTSTLDKLCQILDCEVSDIITYSRSEEKFNQIPIGSFVASDEPYITKKQSD